MKTQKMIPALLLTVAGVLAFCQPLSAGETPTIPSQVLVQLIDFHGSSQVTDFWQQGLQRHQRTWGPFSKNGLECRVYLYSSENRDAILPRILPALSGQYNEERSGSDNGFHRNGTIRFMTARGAGSISCDRYADVEFNTTITLNDINAAMAGQLVVGTTQDEVALRIAAASSTKIIAVSPKLAGANQIISDAALKMVAATGKTGSAKKTISTGGTMTAQ